MPTNDKKANLYYKRLLSLTTVRENFLDFLNDEIDEIGSAIFQGVSGVLDTDIIGLAADGNDMFKVDLTNASRVIVSGGQIIDLSKITGDSITQKIQFENASAVDYYVGVKFAEVEDGIEANPKTGDPEYPNMKQTYGEAGNPDSITDSSTYIRLVVNGLTESGVDHSGRAIRVWLEDPVSLVEGTAFYDGTIAYSAPNNYVDIPYSGSDGPLGQDTGINPPSTTAADYKCHIEGVTWKRNTDLSADHNYAFLGTVRGAGAGNPPSTFDTTLQNEIFIISLNRAYDGPTGAGGGRKITVVDGAVELNSGTADTGDTHHSQLKLTRIKSTQYAQFMLEMVTGDNKSIPLAILQPLDVGDITWEEAVNQEASGRIRFTRGGIDITTTTTRLNRTDSIALVILENSPEEGLYGIGAIGNDYIDLFDLQTGLAPSPWTVTTGQTARVVVPKVVFSSAAAINEPIILTMLYTAWKGSLFVLRDGKANPSPIRILPENAAGDLILLYDNGSYPSVGIMTPNVMAKWSNVSVGSESRLKLKIGNRINPGAGNRDWAPGVEILTHPQADADLQALNFILGMVHSDDSDSLGGRCIGISDHSGDEFWRVEHCGRIAKPNYFEDDFYYGSAPAHLWTEYKADGGNIISWNPFFCGNGNVVIDSGTGPAHSWTRLYTNVQIGYLANIGRTVYNKLYFTARFRATYVNNLLNQLFEIGWGEQAMGSVAFGWRYSAAGSASELTMFSRDPSNNYNETLGKGTPAIPSGDTDRETGWIQVWCVADLEHNLISGSISTGNGLDGINFVTSAHADWEKPWELFVRAKSTDGVSRASWQIDYMALWDNKIKSGPKDRNS